MEFENCEFEQEQRPDCQVSETPVQTVADKVLPALKDPMFFAICILASASALISLCLGSIPLINILLTVFLWLTYAQSRKDITDVKHLRCISGTIYAEYIIAYVIAGILLLVGALLSFVFSLLTANGSVASSLLSKIMEINADFTTLLEFIGSVSGIVIFVLFAFLAGMIVLVNVFTTRYFHSFLKSLYTSIQSNSLELKHTNAAKICLYIFSGFSAVSALSYLGIPLQLLSHSANCAVALLTALLIQKYFLTE